MTNVLTDQNTGNQLVLGPGHARGTISLATRRSTDDDLSPLVDVNPTELVDALARLGVIPLAQAQIDDAIGGTTP